jgi:hypothetical protein
LRKGIFILLFVLLGLLTPAALVVAQGGGIGVHPSYLDLGRVEQGSSCVKKVTVTNSRGEAIEVDTEVKGKGGEWISLDLTEFTLNPGEERKVTLKLDVPRDATPAPYDLSIVFRTKPQGEGVVAIPGANLRFRFLVTGVSIASFHAPDTEKPNPAELTVILANFYDKAIRSKLSLEIVNSNGDVVAVFQGERDIKPYPERFYGTYTFSWNTEDAEMGDYGARGKVIFDGSELTFEKFFTVGWMKGEILSVAANDVTQGETVYFTIRIGNTGNLPLPVGVKLVVKDKEGKIVLDLERSAKIPPFETKEIILDWNTGFPDKVPAGEYTALFDIDYGHDHYQTQIAFEVKRILPLYVIIIIIAGVLAIVCIGLFLRKRSKALT